MTHESSILNFGILGTKIGIRFVGRTSLQRRGSKLPYRASRAREGRRLIASKELPRGEFLKERIRKGKQEPYRVDDFARRMN